MQRQIVSHKILSAVAALILSSCGYYNENFQKQTGAQTPFRQNETLGFETVKTILSRNQCFECHAVIKGNRGGVNLETYNNAKALASRIADTTATGFMPFAGPRVSAEDVAVLMAWSDVGAPETSTLPLPGAGAP